MRRIRKPDPRDGWYEIKTGKFRENGETIILTDTGRMLDGQHRCRAVILAARSITTYVVFGVPESAFASLDQGLSRNGADLAALLGFKNYHTIASVARTAIRYADGTLLSSGPATSLPNQVLRPYFERNADKLALSVAVVMKHRTDLQKIITMSHAAFLYYMLAPAHAARCEEFLESLATGANLARGDARLLFRSRMLDLAGERHKLTQEVKLALLIKTWNAHYLHEKIGVLRFRDDEIFPKIAE